MLKLSVLTKRRSSVQYLANSISLGSSKLNKILSSEKSQKLKNKCFFQMFNWLITSAYLKHRIGYLVQELQIVRFDIFLERTTAAVRVQPFDAFHVGECVFELLFTIAVRRVDFCRIWAGILLLLLMLLLMMLVLVRLVCSHCVFACVRHYSWLFNQRFNKIKVRQLFYLLNFYLIFKILKLERGKTKSGFYSA